MRRFICVLLLVVAVLLAAPGPAAADSHAETVPVPVPRLSVGVDAAGSPGEVVGSLQILVLLTVLSLAPALLVLTTAFTRIAVVFAFLRSALSTQNIPSNQILIGLALFLTFFIMQPTWAEVQRTALQPYLAGELGHGEALQRATAPLRSFMLHNTRQKDLALFINLARLPAPDGPEAVPTHVLIPAFAISELKTAFQIGFLIFVPFLVIDMVVSVTLMSMGMLMLPPTMISLPFKVLLFIMVDGWHLVVQQLVHSFQ